MIGFRESPIITEGPAETLALSHSVTEMLWTGISVTAPGHKNKGFAAKAVTEIGPVTEPFSLRHALNHL